MLTTRELARLIKAAGIDFAGLQDQEVDQLLGEYTGAGTIFGTTGGVMEAALRTTYFNITGEDLEKEAINFQAVRGFEKNKFATINIKGNEVRIAVAHGLLNVKKILDEVQAAKEAGEETPYHFIEIMACYGGCLSGGGQPYSRDPEHTRELRSKGLYTDDAHSAIRISHNNPMIKQLYNDFLGKPLSDKAHKLLHTHFAPKRVVRKKSEL